MFIGYRLRALREAKNLNHGDIERRTGLKRPYVSRVEHCRTVPSIATLGKFACALEVSLYQLFYDNEKSPEPSALANRGPAGKTLWGSSGRQARTLTRLFRLLDCIAERDRRLLLFMAQKMARR
jgi:transcriptional regulator with XRE-family HTH domain